MYCPKCKSEYRDGFTTCSDCKIKLVDQLPIDPEEEIENLEKADDLEEFEEFGQFERFNNTKTMLLETASNEIDAGLIMNLLRNNDIPCYKQSKGAGGYLNIYMGYSVFGEEIYVAEQDYQRAKALLNDLSPDSGLLEDENLAKENIEDTDVEEAYHIPFYKKPQVIARIIIIGYLATMLVAMILNKFF